uniref:MARVEL domain-containing protein n=1 Tax=Setaria digitata TaxID=48799 RepID=A0A915PL92_9BILA
MYNNPICVQATTTATAPSLYFFPDRTIINPYYGGTCSGQSTAYRNYVQLDSSPSLYRRSRTTATRSVPSKIYKTMYTKRKRSYAVDPYFFDPPEYRNCSGLWKDARKWPMYRKKKELSGRIQTYQESEFGGSPIDQQPHYCHGLYRVQLDLQPTALRRIRPYYAPSYVTYPPSIMNPLGTKKKYGQGYSIKMRITVKAIELITVAFRILLHFNTTTAIKLLGAAAIGLILAPMREMSFYAFVKMTQTEWQGLVLGVSASFSTLCLIMLLGACLGYRYQLWRRFDYLISLVGSFGYLFIGAIEAYYAACYPPNGEKIGLVCYRLEWIIASALIFINVTVYIMDCVLSFRARIRML